MIVIDDPNSFSQHRAEDSFTDSRGCVATIGKFDGVHLGHQLILDQLKAQAEANGLPAMAIIIEPHPEEFFAADPKSCPARLSLIEDKLALIESFGIDYALVLRFDQELSELSPEAYIRDILVDALGIAAFIIGDDFRFGHRREGDFALLQRMGDALGFEVVESATYEHNGERISSTYVRDCLAAGNFALVEQLLGRPFSIAGEVIKGQQIGSQIGFPTCNIDPKRVCMPLLGVFACHAKVAGELLPAAVNIGFRPTVQAEGGALLEAHLLDYEGDLYGKTLEVIFREKVRDEMKFDSLDALKRQLGEDIARVRELIISHGRA
ncbi:MAG: bifunctional riboflavin kinase/FAD synthetase [Gammaproteobacteria bacterium]|jgi:riboflavin kinase/FMN adenylyltransferase|nr:bifunctional riboflavin kinase/FAD synthetase [Gammaproteobacteria bacterium]